jgi:glycosyltransferase involved in cell wall biosynthesis
VAAGDPPPTVRSLFVVGLPRSLTTQVYHSAVAALGLTTSGWTIDGEILNGRRLALFPSPAPETDHRFTSDRSLPTTFARIGGFLRDAVAPRGHAYKDVVQPFVVAAQLPGLEVAPLCVRRPLADVAVAMARRGWSYPSAAAAVYSGAAGVVEGLLRAADALSRIAGELVDFDELIDDEASLEAALRRLYPGTEVRPIAYIDGSFRRTRDEVLARRSTSEHRAASATVAEVAAAIGVEVPEGWGSPGPTTPRPRPATGRPVRQPTLLVVGDAVAPTGFARVTRSIISPLLDRFSVHQLGVNYGGDPHSEPWSIYPAGLGGDAHGINRVAEITAAVDPDVVLLVNDLGIVGSYLAELSRIRHRARLVAYVPIDSDPLPPPALHALRSLDRIVVYNEFASRTLRIATGDAMAEDPLFQLPEVDVIPHGVDTGVFRPLFPLAGDLVEGRREVRRTLLPGDESFHRSFVVLNANRNQPRKRIDITIAGFAQFAAGKPPEVKLYLHMGTLDQGWDVRALAQRYGIADRILMSRDHTAHPDLAPEALNLVYNACDVGLNTAESEGWGLPSFEHAATGAAQLVPGHTGPQSIWGDAADLLEPTLRVTNPTTLVDAQLIAASTVAAALERLYANRELLRARTLDAYRHATDPIYSWESSAARFSRLLDALSRPTRPVERAASEA